MILPTETEVHLLDDKGKRVARATITRHYFSTGRTDFKYWINITEDYTSDNQYQYLIDSDGEFTAYEDECIPISPLELLAEAAE